MTARNYGAHRSTRPPLATVVPPRTRDPRPQAFDMVSLEPPLVNQGTWGHCCSSSFAAHAQMERVRQGYADFGPVSRRMLQQFTNASEQHGSYDGKTPVKDSGCSIPDMFYTAQFWGLAPESLWQYNNNLSQFPPAPVLQEARTHIVASWAGFRQDASGYVVEDMLTCLAARQSFVFGFVVWDSLRLDAHGVLTPPPAVLGPGLPGHAVCAVGYNDALGAILCRNSFGAGGLPGRLAGHFWFPFGLMRFPFVFDATRIVGFAEAGASGV